MQVNEKVDKVRLLLDSAESDAETIKRITDDLRQVITQIGVEAYQQDK